MQPKRSRKHVFLYLFVGLFLGLILVVILSLMGLFALNVGFTFNNIVSLHIGYPLYLFIDALVLLIALLCGWIGLEKDRSEDFKNHARRLQNHLAERDNKHAAEILQFNNQLEEQGKKFQELEAVIHRGKEQWEGTFDAVDDLIILTDEAGSILRCNRATGEYFKLGYNQIVGQRLDDLFANASDNPQGAVPGEVKQIKAPYADIWYEISKNHLLIDGMQEGWVYIFRNITAQKLAFNEQQLLTRYYELLVDNNPVGIATLNQEDQIVDCNPAFEKLFDYSKREAVGWKADLLLSPPDLLQETQQMSETVRSGEKVYKVTQRKRKDGTLLDVEVFWIPVILGGKQLGSLGLYHDVSHLVDSQKVAPGIMEQISAEAAPFSIPQPSAEAVADSTATQTRKRLIAVESIEGIGPVYAQKLLEIGVKTTDDLLDSGKTRKGREELVEKTGISAVLVLKWVNMADLMRIRGIGEEFSELLEKAGVDTVKELRNRNPKNLFDAMLQANEAFKLVRRTPHLSEVENWVNEAKELEPVVTY